MSVTPMRRQYLQIKRQHPDAILFFRLGDFYETFDDDARIVSQVCDIVLTSRPVGGDKRVPLAGVPYHALEGYLAKLLAAGYKVAICEQVSDPNGRDLVAREVVRVVTPGTVIEPALLPERRNNYIAAAIVEGERAGLAYADITTGEFATTQMESQDVLQRLAEELARLQPAELLWPAETAWPAAFQLLSSARTEHDAWHFDEETARRALLDHFGVSSLAGYGCDGLPLAVRAAGALLQYLQHTQKGALSQLAGLHTYSTEDFMTLDPATRRNLELMETIRTRSTEGSLLGVLDRTCTSMGARLLRQWLNQPLLDRARLERRLDCVQALVENGLLRAGLRKYLEKVGDLERLINRVRMGTARPRDLVGLRRGLEAVPEIAAFAEGMPAGSALAEQMAGLDGCEGVVDLLARAIVEDPPALLSQGGVIREGYHAELDELRRRSSDARDWVARLEQTERERTGIKSLKVGYNKVFGYYVEVTRPNLQLVPADYIRKQTLANAERFVTPELKEYEALILHAEDRILELEQVLFKEVCERVAAEAGRILDTARRLAQLDVLASLAEVAVSNRYVRPEIAEDDIIDIKAGRHPVVEVGLRDHPFVPNDVYLSPEQQIIILTGPNMSGKSTYLRMVALIVLMAQIGSFVPADAAHIGLVDRIFTRIGAQDEIAAGQSTFMVEMIETANILHHATPRSLVILDEIGRGTSTYDGISIAWAVVEYLHHHPRVRAKTLFATHYHELTELAERLPHVRNYNVAVTEVGDQIVFQHRIVPGGADKSYGIHVARLAGLPRAVVQRAQEILERLERNGTRAPAMGVREPPASQLPLFTLSDPIVEELLRLDINTMTPLEALNALYALQKRAQSRGKG
ncbi:MAG: DNA mismatch repair protein MutS [Anaerolineae bacterium]